MVPACLLDVGYHMRCRKYPLRHQQPWISTSVATSRHQLGQELAAEPPECVSLSHDGYCVEPQADLLKRLSCLGILTGPLFPDCQTTASMCAVICTHPKSAGLEYE